MMTRIERAKQFLMFDAMKGLNEALKRREEQHLRVAKQEISEDDKMKISSVLLKLERGQRIYISHYRSFHNVEAEYTVTEVDTVFKFIVVSDSIKIFFDDIYFIQIID